MREKGREREWAGTGGGTGRASRLVRPKEKEEGVVGWTRRGKRRGFSYYALEKLRGNSKEN